MSAEYNHKSSDNVDYNFFDLTYYFYDRLRSDVFISGITLLVVLAAIFWGSRSLVRYMVDLCYFNRGGVHYMPREKAIQMIEYFNPFTFQLHVQDTNYLAVECTISSTVDSYILPVWGVSIYELFQLLHYSDWSQLKRSICDSSFQNKCMSSNDYSLLPAGEQVRKVFRPSPTFDPCRLQELSCPRLYYPFVLLMVSKNFPSAENSHLVLLANVIHIMDKFLKLPTQLFQQFAKNADGTVATIKNIYPGSFEDSRIGNETVELCLVCLRREISVVILPCGHACVCHPCFELCENCPICRGPRNYYFVSSGVSHR